MFPEVGFRSQNPFRSTTENGKQPQQTGWGRGSGDDEVQGGTMSGWGWAVSLNTPPPEDTWPTKSKVYPIQSKARWDTLPRPKVDITMLQASRHVTTHVVRNNFTGATSSPGGGTALGSLEGRLSPKLTLPPTFFLTSCPPRNRPFPPPNWLKTLEKTSQSCLQLGQIDLWLHWQPKPTIPSLTKTYQLPRSHAEAKLVRP